MGKGDIAKTIEGTFIKNDKEVHMKKIIAKEDTYIIRNFFNEEYYGVFDRDNFSFINTHIKVGKLKSK